MASSWRENQAMLIGYAIVRRSAALAVIGAPALAVVAQASAATSPPDQGFALQLVLFFGLPLALVCALASLYPAEAAPPAAVPFILSLQGLFAVLTLHGAVSKLQDTATMPAAERGLRVGVHFALAALHASLTCSTWRSGGAHAWRDFRLVCVGFWLLRLVANALLRACCAPDSYPPGHFDFASSVGCCAWGMLICGSMTPQLRRRLSAATGCTTVTLQLTDLRAAGVDLAALTAGPPLSSERHANRATTHADSDGHALPPPDCGAPPAHLASAALAQAEGRRDVPAGMLPHFVQAMHANAHNYAAWVAGLRMQHWEPLDAARTEARAEIARGRRAAPRSLAASESTM